MNIHDSGYKKLFSNQTIFRQLLEGKREAKIETAQAMLAKGMEIGLIAEITNLPEGQLLQLKAQLPVDKMLYQ